IVFVPIVTEREEPANLIVFSELKKAELKEEKVDKDELAESDRISKAKKVS
ncbi:hypothetical protein LCGC14_2586020, partial [marine sediment metagenome]